MNPERIDNACNAIRQASKAIAKLTPEEREYVRQNDPYHLSFVKEIRAWYNQGPCAQGTPVVTRGKSWSSSDIAVSSNQPEP